MIANISQDRKQSYSKAETLSNSTKTLYGLGTDAVPDDVLSKLSAASIIKKVPKYTKTTIGGLKVGSTVKLNVNGAAKEFIVVHQGKPSSLYDDSCNGTWLLMKDAYESRQWHSSNSNSYKASTIHSYLNSTFLNLFDADIKAQIKSVKIPYVNGTGASAVASGSSGLAAQIFLLSGYEVGWTNSDNQYFQVDGAKLDYFTAGTATAANNKRIANLNGSATVWWLRSPYTDGTYNAWHVFASGNCSNGSCSDSYGIRPALVLPDTFGSYYVDSDGNQHAEQEYVRTLTDVLGSPATILNSQIIGSANIATGSYTGTGTCGPNAPTTLTFDFAPKLLVIKKKDDNALPTLIFAGDSVAKSITWTFGGGDLVVSAGGNSISWYHNGNTWSANSSSGGSPDMWSQLNGKNAVYFYAAFG